MFAIEHPRIVRLLTEAVVVSCEKRSHFGVNRLFLNCSEEESRRLIMAKERDSIVGQYCLISYIYTLASVMNPLPEYDIKLLMS